jgi:hypothetical protein
MLAIVAVGLLIAFQAAQAPAPSSQPVTGETAQLQQKLPVVKRIYVDSFGDDAVSKQLQGMVVGALVASKRFVVTENKEKADAILRGNALEKTSQEFHALNDKAAVATAAGEHSGSLHGNSSLYGSTVNGTGSISGSGNISCQGRSKTRPQGRSKSRPEELAGDQGLSGRRASGAETCAACKAARLGRSERRPPPRGAFVG